MKNFCTIFENSKINLSICLKIVPNFLRILRLVLLRFLENFEKIVTILENFKKILVKYFSKYYDIFKSLLIF